MSMDTQSNTRVGAIPVLAGEDLTGLEGRLVKLSNDTGTPVAILPTAGTDRCPYVLVEGGDEGEIVKLQPLDPDQSVRATLHGASVVAGDALMVISGAGDYGKVEKLATSQGTYRVVGIAEESAAEGALVLFRPWQEVVVVAGT